MRQRLPSLNAVKTFEVAARRQSFLAAADELFVTPGAVSRQIKTLEAELGVTLFVRGHRRVELTDQGRVFWLEVREALERIAAASARISARGGTGPLALCAHPTFALRWLIPRWGRFYDRHPGIDLQLTTSLARVDFDHDGFDAAVVMGAPADPALDSLALAPVVTFPVASPGLAARLHGPADLAGVTLLHSAPRPEDWPRWLAAADKAGLGDVAAVDGQAGLRLESLNLAFQAAIEGIGVAIGIEALVADDLARGLLVRPFGLARESRRGFHLAGPRRRGRDPRLSAFVGWLREEAG